MSIAISISVSSSVDKIFDYKSDYKLGEQFIPWKNHSGTVPTVSARPLQRSYVSSGQKNKKMKEC